MDLFEFSVRAEVPADEVVAFLSTHFGLPQGLIVDEDAFWDEPSQQGVARLGVSVQALPEGFRTLVNGYSRTAIDGETLGELAREAARHFSSEVAIGDYRETADGPDSFLVYFADGRIVEACDASRDGVNEVKILRTVCRTVCRMW